jgi:hypothetical protein
MHAAPINTNAVPTIADNARNTKNEPRFGASDVATLSKKNDTAVMRFVWNVSV